MARLLTVLLGLTCALPLVAAPIPKHLFPPDRPYFPSEVGTEWVYERAGTECTEVITAVTEKGGAKVVTISNIRGGKTKPWQTVLVSDKGLYQAQASDGKYEPPSCLLPLPAANGARWGGSFTVGDRKWSSTSAVIKTETVEVPAGTFEASRVEREYEVKDVCSGRIVAWFAPGIGLVKQDDFSSSPAGRTEYNILLKSFRRGKN